MQRVAVCWAILIIINYIECLNKIRENVWPLWEKSQTQKEDSRADAAMLSFLLVNIRD